MKDIMKTISVVMATLNAQETLSKALKSIRHQDYDQKKVEIIIADGGSNDNTLKIIKKYGGKIISENTGSPEAAKAIALKYAQGEIVLEIDADNILSHKKWLKEMVSFFDKEKDVVGVYTWRYTYRKKDKILNRYFSLFGANDPVAWFLGRADRQSYLADKWTLSGKAINKGDYFLVEFNEKNLPTVGANGFLIKRKLLMKAKVDEKHFFHIDVNMDLVKKGHNKYVVVKNDIIHDSGERFWPFFAKRKKYMENLYLKDLSNRRYFIYKKDRDREKIILYSLYALTLVGPIFHAAKGFRRLPDLAWFLHPVVCFLMFWVYFLSVLNWQFWNRLGIIKSALVKRSRH
ncbi:hypothetical protein COU96_00235 [Candidatus Shapirobacteria bacterium CG10_big_fil_rev_8_21_14_0_10_38_14]|uniref:Glycosyltransferase 2-like domain-containing protein n=1 Tax=Candidatus Shapirobacteria bacterium CG10_big_fil_rev_8_21_14_0_10_38_14 TaxID=1974483 RepID=A0A2M8L6C1_9BACT|nr:MAG: hypothetical protein COU96_00235 [Candidatus Shapirobacteria bacterium CG10_big_fil_rev_8_21_14_0_10_38_14]